MAVGTVPQGEKIQIRRRNVMETKAQREKRLRRERQIATAAGAGVAVVFMGLLFGVFYSKNWFVKIVSLCLLGGIGYFFYRAFTS